MIRNNVQSDHNLFSSLRMNVIDQTNVHDVQKGKNNYARSIEIFYLKYYRLNPYCDHEVLCNFHSLN